MYNLYGKHKINPELSIYIKEQTNKWLERHIKNQSLNKSMVEVSNLVKNKYDDANFLKNDLRLFFGSFISFLAGYHFSIIMNKK